MQITYGLLTLMDQMASKYLKQVMVAPHGQIYPLPFSIMRAYNP